MKVLRVLLVTSVLATAAAQVAPDSDVARLQASLNQRYANGVVAVVENKIISVRDVMRELTPLLAQLRANSANDADFRQRLDQLADSVTKDLVDRADLIRKFRQDPSQRVDDKVIDTVVADNIAERFHGDRTAFLAYLRAEGKTIRDFRRDTEEQIIYSYMRAQQRKNAPGSAPPVPAPASSPPADPTTPQVHLRILQLNRLGNEAEGALQIRADAVLARLKAGVRFEALAKELSDTASAKGGDWGWVKPPNLKEAFRDIAFALKAGEASLPILLPEGAFILFVEERK